jgi:hypothetical protein
VERENGNLDHCPRTQIKFRSSQRNRTMVKDNKIVEFLLVAGEEIDYDIEEAETVETEGDFNPCLV